MLYSYLDNEYPVIINKKRIKNSYIRVSDDLKIVINTNIIVSNKYISSLIESNRSSIDRMLDKKIKRKLDNNQVKILGNTYNVIYSSSFEKIEYRDNYIFVKDDLSLNKSLNKEMKVLFKKCLDEEYKLFKENIPYPSLRLRKMKTRWGVCNTKDLVITLNTELYKYPPICLEYVVIHELSHLIEPNHNKNFWQIVEEYMPNYKKVKVLLKE